MVLSDSVQVQSEPGNALINGFTRSQIASVITPKAQELIILPTEKCNFRCTYCYEDFEIGRMSENTQRAIELFLDRRVPQLQKLTLSWFGGEPLLAKEVVLRLSRYAYKLCAERDITFNGNMTTNAYLLDKELMSELVDLKLNFYQITLDGWGDVHDVVRRRADGKGTFDQIWSNLLSMRELSQKFEISVRVHVRRDNQENLEKLMIELARSFGSDQRFKLDFQHLRDLGGAGGETVLDPVSLTELEEIEKKLKKVHYAAVQAEFGVEEQADFSGVVQTGAAAARKTGESAGSRSSSDYVEGEPYICYAARPNSLLIRANGRIGKCTVALSDSRNDLGSLLDNGSLEIDNQRLQPWLRGLGSLSVETAGCPMVGMPPEHAILHRDVSSKVVPIVAIQR